MEGIVVAIAYFAIALLVGTIIERKRMHQFWQRSCTGRAWRKRFPDASKREIREFLDLFVDAFGFATSRRLFFAPDDRVMDVYLTRYPNLGDADAMELEELLLGIQHHYGIEILGLWREDITLGELFLHTRPSSDGA